METLNNIISDYYIVIIVITVILVLALIGYLYTKYKNKNEIGVDRNRTIVNNVSGTINTTQQQVAPQVTPVAPVQMTPVNPAPVMQQQVAAPQVVQLQNQTQNQQ